MASTGTGGPIRVLAYSDSKDYSGAEAVFSEVVAGLTRRPGMTVTCAAPGENESLSAALAEAAGKAPLDVPAQPVAVGAAHLFDPRRRRRVARVLAEASPDVLLVNLPSAEYGPTPIGLRPPGVAAVGLLHVPGSPRRLGFRLGAMRERLAKRALRGLDAVCVLTESAGRMYAETWSRNGTAIRTVHLPRPTLEAVDRSDARSELGFPDEPVIGIAGRISIKQKGHDTFIEAASRLVRGGVDASFAVAGTGRDADEVKRRIAELGLEDRFHLLGQVRPISVFLSAIDLIAVPSRFEGLPLVALEALELGVPGIAASTDGLSDVWPEEWRVPPDDPEALAEALRALLSVTETERRDLLEAGRARARACTSDDVAAEVGAVLEEVAGA